MAKSSAAVAAAQGRRAGKGEVKIEWFIENFSNKVSLTIKQRVSLATTILRDKIVRNISRPVTKVKGKGATDRSKAGEFPKADTTLLMKTIFKDVRQIGKSNFEGAVGTPLDYGLILEVKKNRSFLKRTMDEMRPQIMKILTGPIK